MLGKHLGREIVLISADCLPVYLNTMVVIGGRRIQLGRSWTDLTKALLERMIKGEPGILSELT